MTFIDTLLTYARAGYPAVAVVSHEESRVLGELARAAEQSRRTLATWSLTQGWIGLGRAQAQGDPSGAVKAIQEFPEPCFAVLKDFHPYLDSPEVVRTIRDALPILKGEEKTAIFLSPRLTLPMELQKDIALVDFALPDRAALAGLLERLLTDARSDGGPEIPVTHREALLDAARGLTLNEAENALSLALVRHARLDAQAVETVQAEKTALVRKSGLLEVCRPAESVGSIGGLGLLKAWVALQGRLFQDAEAARTYGFTDKDLPRGVCLIGVPGTGKSLTAQAVAASWGLPLLRLDMSRILGSLVSQSEQQMRQALELAEAMAPAVLWADELEKALAGSEASGLSDGGVMARLVGTFLTWLQERTAPLYIVATVNRIGGLPPELLRPGRFDACFFCDLPTPEDLAEVLRIHLAKRRQAPERFPPAEILPKLAGFTPAEVEQVVKAALTRAFAEGARPLETEDLLAAAGEVTPVSVTRAEEIQALRTWAKHRARPASGPADGSHEAPAPGAERRRLTPCSPTR